MITMLPRVACLLLLILVLVTLRPFPHTSASSSAAAPPPVPVILDTDIGDDFDDMMALTYILSAPTLYNPLAILVSTRNTTKRALLVAHTLTLANRTTIPIYVGTVQADNGGNHQYDSGWVGGGLTLAGYRASGGVVYDGCGVCALVEWLGNYSGPAIHVVEIAPVTSLAAMLAKQPSLASKLTVFAMNGEIDVGYNNQTGPEVEWNVLVDVPASRAMYAAGFQYTPLGGGDAGGKAAGLITSPLDSTVFQQWDGELWQRFLTYNNSDHPLAAMLIDAYTHWYNFGGQGNGAILPYSPTTGTSTMYDAQAAYTAAHSTASPAASDCAVHIPHLVSRCLAVYVNASGYVTRWESGGQGGVGVANVSVVVGLEGGRSDPHPAALRIGGVILGSIAGGVDLLSDGDGVGVEGVVAVEVAVDVELDVVMA